jgi:hypothetical protein
MSIRHTDSLSLPEYVDGVMSRGRRALPHTTLTCWRSVPSRAVAYSCSDRRYRSVIVMLYGQYPTHDTLWCGHTGGAAHRHWQRGAICCLVSHFIHFPWIMAFSRFHSVKIVLIFLFCSLIQLVSWGDWNSLSALLRIRRRLVLPVLVILKTRFLEMFVYIDYFQQR